MRYKPILDTTNLDVCGRKALERAEATFSMTVGFRIGRDIGKERLSLERDPTLLFELVNYGYGDWGRKRKLAYAAASVCPVVLPSQYPSGAKLYALDQGSFPP